MAELRTEEEQIEAIKQWWKNNGRSTIVGVVLAIAAVLGWQGWQQQQIDTAAAASALYQNMLSAVVKEVPPTEAELQSAVRFATQLKTEHEGTTYAQFASLWLAKNAVSAGALDETVKELNWVLSQDPDVATAQTAKQRLARVLLAQDKAAEALSTLPEPVPGFESSYYELKGDILLTQGDEDGARSAYQKALDYPESAQRPLLTMKLDDLAQAEAQ